MREVAAAASAVAGKKIDVVQGDAGTRPGFGRPANLPATMPVPVCRAGVAAFR